MKLALIVFVLHLLGLGTSIYDNVFDDMVDTVHEDDAMEVMHDIAQQIACRPSVRCIEAPCRAITIPTHFYCKCIAQQIACKPSVHGIEAQCKTIICPYLFSIIKHDPLTQVTNCQHLCGLAMVYMRGGEKSVADCLNLCADW